MRIPCPYCGFRDLSEFVTIGESTGPRPDPAAPNAAEKSSTTPTCGPNPAGPSEEYWYHAFGCRSWLKVVRDTRTHAIESAVLAREGAR